MFGKVTAFKRTVMALTSVKSVQVFILLWRRLHGVMVKNAGFGVRLARLKHLVGPLTSCLPVSRLHSEPVFPLVLVIYFCMTNHLKMGWLKTTHLLPDSVSGAGIPKWISWEVLACGLCLDYHVRWDSAIPQLDWGWRICFYGGCSQCLFPELQKSHCHFCSILLVTQVRPVE